MDMHMTHERFRRRNTSSFERLIRDSPSFKAILELAAKLEKGHGDARSSSSIADYFMRQNQKAVETGLQQQQQLLEEHMGTQQAMAILWFSSHYSWEAARVCGSLFRSILDSMVYMRHVRDILDDPAGRSLAGDRMQKLGNPEDLFSKGTVDQILHVQNLFTELDRKFKEHKKRFRVRFSARIGALNCAAKEGVSKCTARIRVLKSTVRSGCTGYAVTATASDDDQEEVVTGLMCDDTVEHSTGPERLHPEVEKPAWIRYLGLGPLHKLNVQLHEVESRMYFINTSLGTLMCQVNSTQIYLGSPLPKGLRNVPWSEDIVEWITECHHNLGNHLEDLKEEVLRCFCLINNARDLIYSAFRPP